MEIRYWGDTDWIKENEKLRIQDMNSKIYMNAVLERYIDEIPPINSIEIETVNRCNNDCSFCPVSRGNDIRPSLRMNDKLFYKIIDQLEEMGYEGYLSLFSNNEPLLDTRIFEFLEYAVHKLPKCKHAMFTNGILLDVEKYQKLVALLDYLVIDNYDDNFALMENIDKINKSGVSDGKCKVRVDVRKKNQVLSNRGGLAPNKNNDLYFESSCVLPFLQMVIRPDGKVSRCCQDAYGRTTLGDLEVQSIKEIWEGEAYRNFRKDMIEKGRNTIDTCKNCDLFGLNNYFPSVWINQYYGELLEICEENILKKKKVVIVGGGYESSKLQDVIRTHGMKTTKVVSIDSPEEDCFYIITDYNWNEICKFGLQDVGDKYIVFENPHRFLLQNEEEQFISIGEQVCKLVKACLNGKLIIFGAGKFAEKLVSKLDLKVLCFVDNNKNKHGENFCGSKIYSVEYMLKMEDINDCIILVASNKSGIMTKQLVDLGIKQTNIIDGNIFM